MLAQFVRVLRFHEFWWGSFLGSLFFLLPIIAIVFGLIMWSRDSHRHRHPMPPPPGWGPPQTPPSAHVDPALNEARLRYARGEISRDDYLRIATDLTGQSPPTA